MDDDDDDDDDACMHRFPWFSFDPAIIVTLLCVSSSLALGWHALKPRVTRGQNDRNRKRKNERERESVLWVFSPSSITTGDEKIVGFFGIRSSPL
jgi:hypothetical protein